MSQTKIIFLIVLIAVATVRRVTGANDDPVQDDSSYRLPRDTEPVAYGLRLAPVYNQNSDRYQFSGQVEILLKVNRFTSTITLNAKDIRINSAEITEYKTQTNIEVDGCIMVPDKEWVVIYPAKNLLKDRQYQLKLVFQGLLRTDMTGFYKSTYWVNNVNKCVLSVCRVD